MNELPMNQRKNTLKRMIIEKRKSWRAKKTACFFFGVCYQNITLKMNCSYQNTNAGFSVALLSLHSNRNVDPSST